MTEEEKQAYTDEGKKGYRFRQGEHRVLLASSSPRRRELSGQMGLRFLIRPTDADESLPDGIPAAEAVCLLAERKARAAMVGPDPREIVIAADTTVELDGRILGKPATREEAFRMLSALSGHTHAVHTGVAVACGDRLLCDRETSYVTFRALNCKEIYTYIDTGEPMDKAGAYGIQGGAWGFVSRLDGHFDNVVGLPTRLLDRLLCELTGQDRNKTAAGQRGGGAIPPKEAPENAGRTE